MTKQLSEFGKGFIYNLVLFCKHHDHALAMYDQMHKIYADENEAWEKALPLWFNGAGDHFFEFTIPSEYVETDIGDLALRLKTTALDYRMAHKVTLAQFKTFYEDIERLAMLIDKELGIKVLRAEWS